MIALDPGTTDDLPFALPGSGSSEQSAQSGPGQAPSFDDDSDGTLDPHEDGGQAGTPGEPDQGPAVGPAADSDEQGGA